MTRTQNPTTLLAWQALQNHFEETKTTQLRDRFKNEAARFNAFSIQAGAVFYDYSKNHIGLDTIDALMDLAKACDVEGWRDKMFSGEAINESEDRAVLHTALRGSTDDDISVDGEVVAQFVADLQDKIKNLSDKIRGYDYITDVVNIGIGGSDLGPNLVYEALSHHADGPRVHFVSNVDGSHIAHVLKDLNPKNTYFIIASKTFTTQETLTNARTARAWFLKDMGESDIPNHFAAVSTNIKAAGDFGINAGNILPMRDWIGGRYSVWSGIGLPVAVSIGFDKFKDFLNGAHMADDHFKNAALDQNIPVLMAMIGVWYRNFYNYDMHAVLPYSQYLDKFASFLQQLDMESNGKAIDRNGERVDYQTGPIIFGNPGTNAQHAFFQLLHQGTTIVPADFICAATPEHDIGDHHQKLLANCFAQTMAMMDGQPNPDQSYRLFEGNRPTSTFVLDTLTPEALGMLIAFYEHKVFVQGIVWNINSFDQWGVELGKILAKDILSAQEQGYNYSGFDSSTAGLLSHVDDKKT